ncbi:ABC transporter substrate-binding protein [Vallitalea okinawensis]|uniref:ABC transporter substrate-binding protein n=1 Tax=Vallitalea okinawensis TaxID=2078660 RepID=UPI000CFB295E|nr:ABC transporter substrate-binding protein [Vallitalea okinawensis]
MNIKKITSIVLVLVFACALLLQGCSASGSDTLTIYTALPESEIPSYLEAFEADTGIKVEYVRLSAGEILSKLQVEKNNPQASVWYGGPADTFVAAAKEGLLESYKSDELKNIPDNYIDPDGTWSPIYVGALAFACDKEWFDENGLQYPTSWADLLKPEFEGQISMAHPGSSGTAYTILSTIVQLKGEDDTWDYFSELDKNIRQYTKSGSAPPKNVALGEAAIGISFSHDCLKPTAEGYPIELSFPADGTGYEIGGVALIKDGPEMENGQKFIDWCLSAEGQNVYSTNSSFRLPINTEAIVPEGAVNIADLAVIDYDFSWAGENRKRLVEEFTNKVANKDNLK